MKYRSTLVLLVVSLIAGITYFLVLAPRARETKQAEELSTRFFRKDPGKIEFLRLRNARGSFTVVRENEAWMLKSPRTVPADTQTIDRILGLLRSGEIRKVVTGDTTRLAEFGLEAPLAVLAVGYEGRIDELAVGSQNPAKTARYAYAKGVNAVFLVDGEIAEVFQAGLYELRSKTLFRFDPERVAMIKITTKKGVIEIERGQASWRFLRPFSERASDSEARAFLVGLLGQRSDELYDDRVPNPKEYADAVTVMLTEQAPVVTRRIAVYYWGTGAGQGTIAYQQDMPYSGRLPREFWNFVNRDAASFRNRNLFAFEENAVRSVHVTKENGEYRLVRKGGTWTVGGRPAKGEAVIEFLWFLKAWNAAKLLDPSNTERAGKPALEIVVLGEKGDRLGRLAVSKEKIEAASAGYTKEGEAVSLSYAVSDNLRAPCAVSSLDLAKVPDLVEIIR